MAATVEQALDAADDRRRRSTARCSTSTCAACARMPSPTTDRARRAVRVHDGLQRSDHPRGLSTRRRAAEAIRSRRDPGDALSKQRADVNSPSRLRSRFRDVTRLERLKVAICMTRIARPFALVAPLVGVLLAHLPRLAAAQATGSSVVGTVRDGESGGALPYALIDAGQRHTQSDSLGRWSLGGLPAGATHIRVRRVGFVPFDTAVVLQTTGELRVDVQLQPLFVQQARFARPRPRTLLPDGPTVVHSGCCRDRLLRRRPSVPSALDCCARSRGTARRTRTRYCHRRAWPSPSPFHSSAPAALRRARSQARSACRGWIQRHSGDELPPR